jgi:hypothetical protein
LSGDWAASYQIGIDGEPDTVNSKYTMDSSGSSRL